MERVAVQEAFELSKRPESVPSCDLCRAEKKDFVFHRDHICWATINPRWGIPMVVLNRHREIPSPEEQQHMLRVLDHVMGTYGFDHPTGESASRGGYGYSDPQSIPEHYHVQAGKNESLGEF